MNENLLKVFSNIDSKIFESDEVKTKLSEVFTNAVNEEAEKIGQKLFENKEAEYSKILDEMVATARTSIEQDFQVKFNEEVEKAVADKTKEIKDEIESKNSKKIEEEINKLIESNKSSLNIAIKEFIQENKATWENELAVKKAKDLQESFTDLATKFGVEISNLDEDAEKAKLQDSLQKSLDRETSLQEKLNSLLSEKIINEKSQKLTSVQKDNLKKLLESTTFINEEDYSNKVDRFIAVINVGSPSSVNENTDKKNGAKASWQK